MAAGEPRSRQTRSLPSCRELLGELRARTETIVDLPAGEALEIDEVRDEPWWAFNYYLGDLRSRVVVNLDVPTTRDDIVELVAHEVYPGHHTEHSVKEQLLLRDQGLLEESIQLVPIPASLVSEGIAETGPDLVVDDDVAERITAIFRVARARVRPSRGNGDPRGTAADAPARPRRGADDPRGRRVGGGGPGVHRRWALSTPEQAAHSVRFVIDPTWRAYVINYSAGRELVSRLGRRRPGAVPRGC